MDAFKCKMCGGNLVPGDHEGAGTCDSCGTIMTLPKISDDRKLNLYNRANHFRMLKEFDKALAAYEMILNEDNEESEAHWGVVLSRYGIEYVEDPSTHKRIPTCNRMQAESILNDPDYLLALEYAGDGYSRSLYEAEAKAISEIQRGILSISNKEDPYDIFICYKEQSESGQRTKDSALAQDVYYQLKQEGYRVFFSRISLEDKLGQEYEPYIFSALNSAKVMVVIGAKPEYFQAVWVKNEWSRYLKLMKQQRSRVLIPCYRDMDPYELPEELSLLQSLDMAKIGFMQDLVRGIKKIVDAGKVHEDTAAANTNGGDGVGYQGGPSPLLDRALIFLGDGEFEKAEEYLERVLDQDPRNARAYLGKFLAEHDCQEVGYLTANADESWFESNNYRKAVGFAQGAEKSEIEGYRTKVHDRIEQERLRREEAERIRLDEELRVRKEREEQERLEREEELRVRKEREEQERLEREEQERLESEEREIIELIRKKRKDSRLSIFILTFFALTPMSKYRKAVILLESGYSYKAYMVFKSLGDFKDAREKAAALTVRVTLDLQGGKLVGKQDEISVIAVGRYPTLPIPTREGYKFDGWWTGRNGMGVKVLPTTEVVLNSRHTPIAKWVPNSVGDIGPAGGYIFYDKGSYSDGWQYLEAAPASYEFRGKVWGGFRTSVGNTARGIGAGKGNTEKIVSKFGNAEPSENKTDYAAKLCFDLVVTKDGVAYDDWFLPSKDELNNMYSNLYKKGIGGFSGYLYWSSSEDGAYGTWGQAFGNGGQGNVIRYDESRVRPVRAF